MHPTKRDGGRSGQPEIPVIEDPPGPTEPKVPDMPPPVPDPPEVIAAESEERYPHPEGWKPASWRPHAPAGTADRGVDRH
jgi:hypothetical protein